MAATLVAATVACSGQHDDADDTQAQGEASSGWSGDYATDMTRCLSDKGWDVAANEQGGVSYELPSDQEERFYEDSDQCLKEIGYDDDAFFTTEYLDRDYDLRVENAACIEALGYELPDAPSRQAFIDQTINDRFASWEPILDVIEIHGREASEHAQRACERPEPSDVLREIRD
ncbi:hypothetical protein [Phytoactinopolyspora limicola]|uniref:hypothetical protein n=1 Tax=Phytoactinopolyspora limicola TaxID=2715536 RepID=UPI001409F011|nr:hypothetical protein [Phytoactinopolyspora limicola]